MPWAAVEPDGADSATALTEFDAANRRVVERVHDG